MEEKSIQESQTSKLRILVLDCDHKNALAIIRHLGMTKQYVIDAVSYGKGSIAFFSKYVSQKLVIRNPKKEPEGYLIDLLNILNEGEYIVLIPVSYISYQICSLNKDKISQYTHLTIAPSEQIFLASSKVRTYELAEKIRIPYPPITRISDISEVEHIITTFPCVIKGPFETGKNIVAYAQNKAELLEKYREICRKNDFTGQLPFIQKFIQGEGAGFFAFYKNGVCKNYFVHKRIREYPVKGGASTVAESYYNEEIIKYGRMILDALQWEGIAMVEFKKDNHTKQYNLMEINAKFWGSLDLALVCGVSFPQMLIDDALGKEIQTIEGFDHKRFQWILNGDLFHLLERPWILFSFIRDLFFAYNDFYFTDIKPNLFQLVNIPLHYYKKWLK